MRLVKPESSTRCEAIIQPGEFTIDVWDGLRCTGRGSQLMKCPTCGKLYCLLFHYGEHTMNCTEEKTQ